MHIAVAGNIGAGKTSLTELLSKHYKWESNFEDVIDNPYLDDFYNHMERWSFNLQIFFLRSRFKQLESFKGKKVNVIQDLQLYDQPLLLLLPLSKFFRYYHQYQSKMYFSSFPYILFP